jgi:hypothetical protein
MKRSAIVFTIISTVFTISACGNKIPDCSSQDAKDLLISVIKEKVVGNKEDPWYIEPTFKIINTEGSEKSINTCHAQIIFSIPEKWEDKATKVIEVDYKIKINETEKNSFSLSATTVYEEISIFNTAAWKSSQNFLYKKAGIEFLSPGILEPILTKSKNGTLTDIAAGLSLYFANANKKLLELGWTYEGTGKDDKSIEIFSKDKFTLSLKTENVDLFFKIIDPENSYIWIDK